MAAELIRTRPARAPGALYRRPAVLLLGPALHAVSGVATHLHMLLASGLADRYALVHFQVGSEGRDEGRLGRWLRLAAAPWALARAIGECRAAIVHLNTSLNAGAFWRDLVYLGVARACGAAVVLQVHGGALPQDFCRAGRAVGALVRAAVRPAGAVVVLARSEVVAWREFVPWQRVLHVPNALPCPSGPLRDRRPNPQSLRLLYVGRLVQTKGVYEMLEGLRFANAQGASHRLTIAGSGPDEAALRHRVHELGVAANVEFVGAVDAAERTRLLDTGDVFVLATRHAEGLPYALLEAMAAGVPVLTTPVAAIADVVEHGRHGLLVAPGDAAAIGAAIGEFARRSTELAAMGRACRERIAEGYSIERFAQAFGQLYVELLAPPGRGG